MSTLRKNKSLFPCHPELAEGSSSVSSPLSLRGVEQRSNPSVILNSFQDLIRKTSDFLQTKTFRIIFFIGLAFIAFQYLFITRFPIGDDPAIHIANAKFTAYSKLLTRNYPIPISIFKALGQITQIDYIVLFCILISLFLLISALSFFKFSRLLSKDYIFPFAATLIFIGGRWTNDSLRMGLLAEVFAWSILFCTFYFLAKEKLVPLLIFTILLPFSHPLVFMVYTFVFLFYFLINLFTKSHTRLFLLKYAGILLILGLISLIAKPDLIHKFLNFTNKDRLGWGERSLWEIFTTDSKRRLITPLLALIGLIVSVKQWQKPAIKIAYLLTFVGLFLSLNHIFGIHFLPFRFYPYLEMGVAIFAALGIEFMITATFPKLRAPALVILLAAFIITLPNYYINDRYLLWQTRDPETKAIMTSNDLQLLDWIKQDTDPSAKIAAPRHWSIWIKAYSERKYSVYPKTPFHPDMFAKFLLTHKKLKYDYLVYPSTYDVPPTISDTWQLVYNKNGTRVYENQKQ